MPPETTAPVPPASSPAPVTERVIQPYIPPPAGEEVGSTAGGAKIVTSGVKEGQPKEATDFKAAGKAYLESLQHGERTVAEEVQAKVRSEQPPAQRAVTGEAEGEAEGEEEEVVAKPGEIAWDERTRRWKNEKGQFVAAPPPTAAERQEAEGAAAAAPAGEAEEEPAGEPTMFTLPGLGERGEDDIEIDVGDPEVLRRLERNRNDGLRRQAYDEAMRDVTAREAELRAVQEALTIDPVGFALTQMTPERQLEVVRALMVEHFDQLQPEIEAMVDDPVNRANSRVALRDRLQASSAQLADHRARMSHAMACMDAARSLIPDGTDDATAEEFLSDAEQDLVRAAREGRPVAPNTVTALLHRRASLYGFGTEPTGQRRNGTAPSTGSARPLSSAAQAVAARKKDTARATQQHVRRIQIARRSAASVTPPGVGAATVEGPVIPADADVREVSKILRRRGVANSWVPGA